MEKMVNALKNWLVLAVGITLFSGVVYVVAQQNLRMGANDPQIQMAEDGARSLAENVEPESILPTGKIDIALSLVPYLAIFDEDGNLLTSNATLHGGAIEIPAGVFEYTRQHGEDRITWQPEAGVRCATVVVHVESEAGGFVVAGRSLRLAEERVDQLNTLVGLGWLGTMVGTFLLTLFLNIDYRRCLKSKVFENNKQG
jgi:hypothetical protein